MSELWSDSWLCEKLQEISIESFVLLEPIDCKGVKLKMDGALVECPTNNALEKCFYKCQWSSVDTVRVTFVRIVTEPMNVVQSYTMRWPQNETVHDRLNRTDGPYSVIMDNAVWENGATFKELVTFLRRIVNEYKR